MIKPTIRCTAEEVVDTYIHPMNNTYPLWNYGNPTIVRDGQNVYVSIPLTNEADKSFLKTRLQVFVKRGEGPFVREYVAERSDQREPCPIARLGEGDIVVSVNLGIVPFRVGRAAIGPETMWYCEPYVLRFREGQDMMFPEVLKPRWDEDWPFTDHSYRGIATDPVNHEMFVANLEGFLWKPGYLGRFHWAFMDADGKWASNGLLEFPRRVGYPLSAIRNRNVHFVGTSDIDEPNQVWMDYKREVTGQNWDFDFRILYHTETPDIATTPFSTPLEVENVDDTSGHIHHEDLYLAPDGTAHILYLVKNCWKRYMRDKFFPGMPLTVKLVHARVKDGKVLGKTVLAECVENPESTYVSGGLRIGPANGGDEFNTDTPLPDGGSFVTLADGRVFVIYHQSGQNPAGEDVSGDYCVQVLPEPSETVKLDVRYPLKTFYAAALRDGSEQCDCADLFGLTDGGDLDLRYMRLHF